MKTYTLELGREARLVEGLSVKRVTLKNGTSIGAVVLGENTHGYGYPFWVTVGNPPMKPCPEQGKKEPVLKGPSWSSDGPEKAKPAPFKCEKCGIEYGPWEKRPWDNYPGEKLDDPKVRGFAWTCTHPNAGQVYARLMFAKVGESLSGKAKLIGAAPDNDMAVIVRINTNGGYTRGAFGDWRTVAGDPKTVVSTSVPTSSSGRLGTYAEGLVVMKPGDVLRIQLSGGYKDKPYALYFDAEGKISIALFEERQAGETSKAVKVAPEAPAQTAESVQPAPAAPKVPTASATPAAETLYGAMPVYEFGDHSGWSLDDYIWTQELAGGHGFQLGPSEPNKWREHRMVTVMTQGLAEVFSEAGVAKVGNNFVLVALDKPEPGKYLVRVNTEGLRKGGRTGAAVYRGEAVRLTYGYMEHGTVNIQVHHDELWIMAEGDVLRIGQVTGEGQNDYVLFTRDGKVVCEEFRPWQLADARRDPAAYIVGGWCPMNKLPDEWVGRVVSIWDARRESPRNPYGLKAIRPEILFDYAWDALTPPTSNTCYSGDQFPEHPWVHLEASLVWAAPAKVKDVREELKFGEPPLPGGTRVTAQITTTHQHHEASFGYPEYDSTTYLLEIADVPASKCQVTKYEKSGQVLEEEKPLGETRATWKYHESLTTGRQLYHIQLSEGQTELNGEFTVEFFEGRKGGWSVIILSTEALSAEREKMDAEVAAAAQLRAWARPILKPREPEAKDTWYGVPVKDDGYTPCPPEQAHLWVLYMKDYKFPGDPKAFVLVPAKGFRSKTQGTSFEGLKKSFLK